MTQPSTAAPWSHMTSPDAGAKHQRTEDESVPGHAAQSVTERWRAAWVPEAMPAP